ncbi:MULTISPECIES: iron-hydroxamate ABC transporter substrate-binding protein [Sporosarcina]|uniref:iron-hydroxamate ABC transporter substrate-binding protein n=1 Tax=Sporosarcina TaxID=1569 RepID=UPI00058BA315|nr:MULTISPECIES: iron-hydroxamate ABC transporter substrate-binding protein [Sporosarcina]WJY28387.1 iron-hydroxamate ABC transporter substrate-binding protein [Sporosarcina sp. 0.2-SM1T-5]
MKKLTLVFTLLLVLVLGACSSGSNDSSKKEKEPVKSEENKTGTITYESENGPVEVPADPKRVVVLSGFAGHVMALDVPIVGVDSWSKDNPRFQDTLKDAQEVTDEDLEKILELEPDLIIGYSTTNNLDRLKEIAPTVTYTYNKLDYLAQFEEIGKLLNQEQEAKDWVADFKDRAHKAGEEVKAKIGEDKTVSVIENFEKQLYVFGDSWGRGTEILYQEMKLKMPEKVKADTEKEGYFDLSAEVLPEYMGDYVILSKNGAADNSFMETESFKNTEAAKNGHVFVANADEFYFNDPLSLDYQLEFFKENFLK